MAAGAETRATTKASGAPRPILLRVYRHNPAMPTEEPKIVTYLVPMAPGLTVLGALVWAKEHVDPGLAFRCSCRMGICGSCGMKINGVPRLACETQIKELGTDRIEVRPLDNHPLVRDLATDFAGFFRCHHDVKPFLVLAEGDPKKPVEKELLQTEEQKLAYYQFTMCIMCGLCNSACPIVTMDGKYLGPQALAQAYRFNADSRDQGTATRAAVVDGPHGCWRCEVAGSCSAVCPKGVDPAMGIQLLKRVVIGRRSRRK